MKRSANWVRFALALPMKYDPGTHSAYCSPGYHLLGSAIGAAAQISEAEFGRKYLFDPLGIHGVVWADDPQGRSHGGATAISFRRTSRKSVIYTCTAATGTASKLCPPIGSLCRPTRRPAAWRPRRDGLRMERDQRTERPPVRRNGTRRPIVDRVAGPRHDCGELWWGNTGQIAQLVRQAVKSDRPLPPNAAAYAHLSERVENARKAPAAGAGFRATCDGCLDFGGGLRRFR